MDHQKASYNRRECGYYITNCGDFLLTTSIYMTLLLSGVKL